MRSHRVKSWFETQESTPEFIFLKWHTEIWNISTNVETYSFPLYLQFLFIINGIKNFILLYSEKRNANFKTFSSCVSTFILYIFQLNFSLGCRTRLKEYAFGRNATVGRKNRASGREGGGREGGGGGRQRKEVMRSPLRKLQLPDQPELDFGSQVQTQDAILPR